MTSTTVPIGAPLLNAEQHRAVEKQFEGIDLMRRAGKAAADFIAARTTRHSRVLLFAGPGNNGGDALACAAELRPLGYSPLVVLLASAGALPPDARAAHRRAVEAGVEMVSALPPVVAADWIVDGLFGIGLKRPLDGAYREAVQAMASARLAGAQVLALDVPSGVDADTGALVGDVAVEADHTLTFIAGKPGLMTGAALDYVGELHVASIDLDLGDLTSTVSAFGIDTAHARMRPALATAHKGTHGTLTIVGGANGMLGAVLLASRAAMRMGAGKVKVAWLADPHPQVDPMMPEVMMRAASDLGSDNADSTAQQALVIGCGMGTSGAAVRVLKAQLKRELPMVIDADALNLIAQSADLAALVQRRQATTIITPHPAEAARLLGAGTSSVQSDRLRAARDLAKGYQCIAVLKGAGTVVDDGTTTTINTTGNPLLATAGTGDVLAGMIGALLAQGYAGNYAARIAVALHGAAADALAARGVRRAVASDVIAEIATLG